MISLKKHKRRGEMSPYGRGGLYPPSRVEIRLREGVKNRKIEGKVYERFVFEGSKGKIQIFSPIHVYRNV